MIQLLIQEYKNGPLVIDATFLSSPPKTGTNKYGFATLEFSFIKDIKRVQKLFQDNPMYHVRLGTADYVIWEGRLEEVQIATDRIDCIAYGYIRAFSDLEVTDLWSKTGTEDFEQLNTVQSKSYYGTPDRVEFQNDGDRIHFAWKKNENLSAAGVFTYSVAVLPTGSSRDLKALMFTASAISNTIAMVYFSRAFNQNRTIYSPVTDLYSKASSTSFIENVVSFINVSNVSGISLNWDANTTALYVGETGDLAVDYYNVRYGTTTSISGNRLYADEVLKYYASGVITLNSTQLSSNFSEIQSPLFDLRNVIYERVNGMDVLEDLLSRPTNTGMPFELKIWENQKVIFRQKTYNKTWYIPYKDIEINRVTGLKYNKVRALYKSENGDTVATAYITDSNPPYRELTIEVDTTSEATALEKVQAYLNSDPSVVEAKIQVSTVRTSNQSVVPSYFVRSGDRIIIIDIPMELYDDINTSFLVGETNYDFSTGLCEIVPEDLTTSLDILIAGK